MVPGNSGGHTICHVLLFVTITSLLDTDALVWIDGVFLFSLWPHYKDWKVKRCKFSSTVYTLFNKVTYFTFVLRYSK